MPLPKKVMDMIAYQAEKLVPDSTSRLYKIAHQIELHGHEHEHEHDAAATLPPVIIQPVS